MEKCFCLILLLLVSLAAVGCNEGDEMIPSTAGCGMVDDAQSRNLRVSAISNLQNRMLLDDWDELWFYDTNLKMTQWAVNVGD